MSYNIMSKNASFKGDISGTIENQVNDWDTQSIGGNKTFTSAITSSADVMLSGSGKVSASFFYGDGTGLTNVGGTISSYTNHATNRLLAGGASSTAIKGLSEVTFTSGKLGVTGQISASLGVSGSEIHGDGSNLTAVTASFVTASNVNGILNASQVNIGDGLEDSSNAIRVKLASNSGLGRAAGGMSLDVHGLSAGSYADSSTLALGVSSGNTTKITLSVLEQNINVSGTNIVGTINNASLPTQISRPKISGSVHISGAFFFGDGAGLTNVTAGGAGANTQVQFNDGGSLAGNAGFTFGKTTAVMTVTTGSFSKISSSLIPVADNAFRLGDADVPARWSAVDAVLGNFSSRLIMRTGSVSYRLGVGTTNPQNELEVTGAAVVIGEVSASGGITGSAFYGSGTTLTGVPFTSGPSTSNIVFVADGGAQTINTSDNLQWTGTILKATNLSASANLQVGGDITASFGDIVLGKPSAAIKFDPAASTGATTGPLIQANSGLSTLMVDGDSTLSLQADENINLRVGGGSGTGTRVAEITAVHFSSSLNITGATFNSPQGTLIDANGNFQGNNASFNEITASSVISSSANISGAAFYGDGSNLSGISSYSYDYLSNPWFSINNSAADSLFPMNAAQTRKGGAALEIYYTAPASGSVRAINVARGLNDATGSSGGSTGGIQNDDTFVFYMYRNGITATEGSNPTMHCTSSAANLTQITYNYDGGSQTRNKLNMDLKSGTITVSGSNTFAPGDVLAFGLYTNSGTSNAFTNMSTTITLELDETWSL